MAFSECTLVHGSPLPGHCGGSEYPAEASGQKRPRPQNKPSAAFRSPEPSPGPGAQRRPGRSAPQAGPRRRRAGRAGGSAASSRLPPGSGVSRARRLRAPMEGSEDEEPGPEGPLRQLLKRQRKEKRELQGEGRYVRRRAGGEQAGERRRDTRGRLGSACPLRLPSRETPLGSASGSGGREGRRRPVEEEGAALAAPSQGDERG